MRRLAIILLLTIAPFVSPFHTHTPRLIEEATAAESVSAKEAFEAAKELGTAEAWNAFLESYPTGFHANLARAYLAKLGSTTSKPAGAKQQDSETKTPTADETPRGANASLGGRRLLPDDSPWHQDISQSPVDPNSEEILARIGMDKPLRTQFGPEWEGSPWAFHTSSSARTRRFVQFTYADESDAGPYPIPLDAPIEGGPNGDGDRHVLAIDRDGSQLWELFNAFPDGNGGWKADSGAIWNLKENQVRPPRWTSADAAGPPILPGLVRYDEVVEKGALEHAMRFTLQKSRRAERPPASHWGELASRRRSATYGHARAPQGRFVSTYGFAPEAQVILRRAAAVWDADGRQRRQLVPHRRARRALGRGQFAPAHARQDEGSRSHRDGRLGDGRARQVAPARYSARPWQPTRHQRSSTTKKPENPGPNAAAR